MDFAAIVLLIMAGSVLIYFVGAVVLLLAGPLAVAWAYWQLSGDTPGAVIIAVFGQAIWFTLYWGIRRGKKAKEAASGKS